MSFSIKVNEGQLEDVQKLFAAMPGVANRVTVRAINLTLSGVKTDASTQIRTIITASKKTVDAHMSTRKADPITLSGQVTTVGGPLPFIEFKTSQTKVGTKVQIYKAGSSKMWTSAFITTMKSGHKGVFKREYKGVPSGKYVKRAWAKMPQKYRLPIGELYGPKVPSILEDNKTMSVILSKAGDRVVTNFEHETAFELSKL